MDNMHRVVWAGVFAFGLCAGVTATAAQKPEKDSKGQDNQRPKLTLKATPPIGVSPSLVVVTAELQGGANDFEEYYCPTIQWEWGDDAQSEVTSDCEPYEAGKSEIRRRFTTEHVFRRPGSYKVFFRLKRHNKAVGSASTNVQIQPGAGF